jgi:diaminohydroxyphosphoribosylaminopyrimidine deaminase / 5-amino-6-(5-phosphoribosylamino)uracil reductase
MSEPEADQWFMRRALELAARGQGMVEPNPMVGAVITRDGHVIAEGYHRRYGEAHAEADALARCTITPAGATMYVTLEPCCHQGKTPPCTKAIIGAGIQRVVAAMPDPFPQVAGKGLAELTAAGIQTEVGLLEDEARSLNGPYLKLVETGRPWIIAKWAMTLDGKIASRTGDSRWISSEASRAIVHSLRGRMDAIVVGSETAVQDDPALTPRPTGTRTALRVVVDSHARLPLEGQLIHTASEIPVLVAVSDQADRSKCAALSAAGVELFVCKGQQHAERLEELLAELGRRRCTNVLVEGGGKLLGLLNDLGQINEAHVFIAPKLLGGADAKTPIAGLGAEGINLAGQLTDPQFEFPGGDVYIHGRLSRAPAKAPQH